MQQVSVSTGRSSSPQSPQSPQPMDEEERLKRLQFRGCCAASARVYKRCSPMCWLVVITNFLVKPLPWWLFSPFWHILDVSYGHRFQRLWKHMETPPFSENAFVLGGPFLPMFAGRIFGPSGRPQAPGSLRPIVSWRSPEWWLFSAQSKWWLQRFMHKNGHMNHWIINLSMYLPITIIDIIGILRPEKTLESPGNWWSQVTALILRIGPLAAAQLHRCPGKAQMKMKLLRGWRPKKPNKTNGGWTSSEMYSVQFQDNSIVAKIWI